MIKKFFLLITFIFILNYPLTIYADEIKVTASVDKTVVEKGAHLRFTVGVHGAFDTDQPQLPPLEGFSLMYGPSVSTQTKIVNNVVSVFRGFTYGLIPKEKGKFELGPVTLKYKGKTYKSNTVIIEVVDRTPFEGKIDKNRDRSKDIAINKRIFVELITDKKEAYIYEQIIRSFKLYFQRGLPIDDLEYIPASTKSFLAEKLGEEKRYEEVRDGILYNVLELRTALFPLVTGNIEIPPANFKCNILIRQHHKRNWDPFENFFDNSLFDEFLGRNEYRYPVERNTNSIKLKIKPLPESEKPKDFAGAVGKFTMDVLVKPAKVKVGDPVTLSINIRGKGNIKTLGEPTLALENTNDFELYPAEANTTITDKEEGIKGEKLFNKVIEPQHENIKATPAISFSFFDPELEKYETITHEPIPVVVEHSDVEIPIHLSLEDAEKAKGRVKILTKDILPIMSDLYSFKNQGFALYKRPLFLVFIFLTPILFVIACVYVQRHRELLQTDVSYARKKACTNPGKKNNFQTRDDLYNLITLLSFILHLLKQFWIILQIS
ncbi:MAG: hypothetical protein SCARUB_03415 [Candidatus Scalindua rubra]|uniref:Protein BatD n=1 Tax=Candidatus Scalindua rubra TaxID=1872076 RepID=A0A1E3X750_9BACT|nr:MAG: hypothetical protein SCARUB_03415 [Candidatus Scalindua rubra]